MWSYLEAIEHKDLKVLANKQGTLCDVCSDYRQTGWEWRENEQPTQSPILTHVTNTYSLLHQSSLITVN